MSICKVANNINETCMQSALGMLPNSAVQRHTKQHRKQWLVSCFALLGQFTFSVFSDWPLCPPAGSLRFLLPCGHTAHWYTKMANCTKSLYMYLPSITIELTAVHPYGIMHVVEQELSKTGAGPDSMTKQSSNTCITMLHVMQG